MNNNIFKRTLAILLAIITIFSASIFPASAEKKELKTYQLPEVHSYSYYYHNGIHAPLLTDFLDAAKKLNRAVVCLTGITIFDEDTLDFTADGFADEILKILAEESFADGYEFANGLPMPNKSSQMVIDILKIDVPSKVDELESKIRECNKNGETVKSLMFLVYQTYLKQVQSVYVYDQKINDTTYQMICEMTYKYGGTERYELDFYYDTEKQLYYSGNDTGLFGLGFHFDLRTNTLYATVHPWQRNFGFCLTYDLLANIIVMDYDTERVKFTYGGKDWMIQFWKGRYFVCPGAEVGIYNRDEKKFGTIYNCANDDELMNMYLELYHEDELIFSEGPMMHWWITGFDLNDKYYLPESLTSKGFIDFPSEEMANLFMKSAKKKLRLKTSQEGVRVSFEFK